MEALCATGINAEVEMICDIICSRIVHVNSCRHVHETTYLYK